MRPVRLSYGVHRKFGGAAWWRPWHHWGASAKQARRILLVTALPLVQFRFPRRLAVTVTGLCQALAEFVENGASGTAASASPLA